MNAEKREEFRSRIDNLSSPEELDALLRDLKEEGHIPETSDLAEEAVMVASARQIPLG